MFRKERLSVRAAEKKKEFTGLMNTMAPGNSFPQICVVSINKIVEKTIMAQEYLRPMTFSNHRIYHLVNRLKRVAALG